MLLTTRWNRRRAASQLDRLADAADTYCQAVDRGANLHHVHESTVIGSGAAAFRTAGFALASLAMHRQAGLRVVSSAPSASTHSRIVLGYPIGPMQVLAPCRVSETWDSPSESGFSYVTLPGHPECGYEKFLLTRAANDEVRLDIWSHSRSSVEALQPFAGVNRFFQRRITRQYQQALRAIVQSAKGDTEPGPG